VTGSPQHDAHRPGVERRAGEVEEFDEAVGLGVIAEGPGGARYPFHCTQIADGSRSIGSGAHVSFVVIPGRAGRWEAGDICLSS
jgi:cold shock CspA family protein